VGKGAHGAGARNSVGKLELFEVITEGEEFFAGGAASPHP
jgi:hypothetical protein